MLAQEYWDSIGSKKDFEDLLFLNKLTPFIHPSSQIVEYGCGYGRMLKILQNEGYKNLIGFDFAPSMIERGKHSHPDLNLQLLKENGKIPLAEQSTDALIMSTVLCCMIEKQQQVDLMEEIYRVLKSKGILYLSDFLLCDHPRYFEKYKQGFQLFNEWGIYTTNENLTVRHHTTKWITELLEDFDLHWFEQSDFKTMNQNPARTFHCIAIRP